DAASGKFLLSFEGDVLYDAADYGFGEDFGPFRAGFTNEVATGEYAG
ncbi:unnamed protein product, partial [marine sediment metagenome]